MARNKKKHRKLSPAMKEKFDRLEKRDNAWDCDRDSRIDWVIISDFTSKATTCATTKPESLERPTPEPAGSTGESEK